MTKDYRVLVWKQAQTELSVDRVLSWLLDAYSRVLTVKHIAGMMVFFMSPVLIQHR